MSGAAKEKEKETNLEGSTEIKPETTSSTDQTKALEGKDSTPAISPEVEKIINARVEERIKEASKKARSDERDKLYESLEKLEKDLKGSKDFIDQLKAEKDSALAEEKKKREAVMSDTEKLQLQIAELTEKLNLMGETHSKTKTELEAKIRKKELDLFKKDIIVENKGSIIESLIRGDSEEEILQSLETAKKEYLSIVESVKNQQKDNLQQVAKTNAPKPTSNQNIIQQPVSEKDINSLTREELERRKNDVVSSFLSSQKK